MVAVLVTLVEVVEVAVAEIEIGTAGDFSNNSFKIWMFSETREL